jgi:hypothetical protein
MSVFYSAWVDPTDTVFDPSFQRQDLSILSLEVEHLEGQCPTLQLEIRNPYVGLLNPGHKQWLWLAWQDPTGHVWPLIFCRLVAVPGNIFGEVVTLHFIAQPTDFYFQKQAVAEGLKKRPNYDPVFLDLDHRDDPDSVLKGWTKLYHVGRIPETIETSSPGVVTLPVTVSDISIGEDGTEYFTEDDVFYDSVKMEVDQQPITAVEISGAVSWTQADFGYVDMGNRWFYSYTGQSLLSSWPQPGAGIGQGWSVTFGVAFDVNQINNAITGNINTSWQNLEATHTIGDAMSWNVSVSYPVTSAAMIKVTLTEIIVAGLIDPDPDAVDHPTASIKATYLYIPLWTVSTFLKLQYAASRSRTEFVAFVLRSNVQPVVSLPPAPPFPATPPETELIQLKGADVGVPLTSYNNLTGDAFHPVDIPGYTAGVLPQVSQSMILGASWSGGQATIVCRTNPGFPVGDTPGIAPGDAFQIAHMVPSAWNGNWIVVSTQILQFHFPDGSPGYQLVLTMPSDPGAPQAGGDGYGMPFSLPPGTPNNPYIPQPLLEQDAFIFLANTAVPMYGWGSGVFYIPIADQRRRSYFPTDRGLWSLEYLISVAVARLAMKARVVTISWDCRIERLLSMSCRWNASITDHRLPGGIASGKVIAYKMTGNGDNGELLGNITIGCSVGMGGHVVSGDGVGVYADSGYMQTGYQQMAGNAIPILDESVSYSTPLDDPNDDGLTFPLTKQAAVASEQVIGTIQQQQAALAIGIRNTVIAAQLAAGIVPGTNRALVFHSIGEDIATEEKIAFLSNFGIGYYLYNNPIYYSLEMMPVTNGPFTTSYNITVSDLELPQTINLAAGAHP